MEAHWSTLRIAMICAGLALVAAGSVRAQSGDGLLQELQRVIEAGEKAPADVLRSLRARIEADPQSSASLIAPKLRDPQVGEAALVVYVWAIGLTQQAETAEDLIALANARAKDSPRLMQACRRALANTGGARAGAFLMTQVEAEKDPEARFDLLNLLGQMQYKPALPVMAEVLDADRENYWKPMFVFGKMGDAAVPYLITQVGSGKRTVRFNAVAMLKWLIPSEAAAPLQARFWQEEDPEIRSLILAALEGTETDLSAMRRFSQEVLAREKDERVRQFAQETVDSLAAAEGQIGKARARKRDDRATFQRHYAELYRSAGKEGSLEELGEVSVLADEPQLKKLRERVLQRDSDEAFYDYDEINAIILNNRHIYGLAAAATRPATSKPTP